MITKQSSIERMLEGIRLRREARLDSRTKTRTSAKNQEKTLDFPLEKATIKVEGIHKDGGDGSRHHGHTGNPGHVGGSVSSSAKENLETAIKNGEIKRKIDDKKQKKHRLGSNAYKAETEKGLNKSIVTLSNEKLRTTLNQYSGNGNVIEKSGHFKEVFESTETIGYYVSSDGKEVLETNRGTIHYSKTGCHIVPAKPKGTVKRNE